MSVPRSPMDVDTTKRLLDERIASGEITQGDVDLIKKGYRWMALSTLAGATSGLPIWFLLSRGRRIPFVPNVRSSASSATSASTTASQSTSPTAASILQNARSAAQNARNTFSSTSSGAGKGNPGRVQIPPLGFRIAVTAMIAGSGSFLGFTAAGAAAALEVNNKMVDSKRKMKVFEEVMIASRAEAEARRMGLPAPIPSASSSSSRSRAAQPDVDLNGDEGSSVWDPEKAEMAREQERERGRDDDALPLVTSQGSQSAWDRLRTGSTSGSPIASPTSSSFPSTGGSVDPRTLARTSNTTGTGFAGGGLQGPQGDLGDGIVRKGDDERERERREFDALMERERRAGQGADGGETGFEKGRW